MEIVANIGGREAIPVRAIPFVTNWGLDPFHLVEELARSGMRMHVEAEESKDEWVQVWNITAYRLLSDGRVTRVTPAEWQRYVDKLGAHAQVLRKREEFSDELLQTWRNDSIEILPEGVFVWKDELQSTWAEVTQYIAPSVEGDTQLVFQPILSKQEHGEVMLGFGIAEAVELTVKSGTRQTVVPFKKAALIDAHIHEWPTIERDIADAQSNGLAKAAKAGERGWFEDAAMEWARANGKLKNTGKPVNELTQAMHSMSSLPSRRHTLLG